MFKAPASPAQALTDRLPHPPGAEPRFQLCFPIPLHSSERGRKQDGRCSLSSISRCRFPSQLRGKTGLALPGLCPSWRRGHQHTLAIPRQICCGSTFLPCSACVDVTPPTARATARKMAVVLERGAASGAEQSTLGASWPAGTHPAASAAAGLDLQPSLGTAPPARRLLLFNLGAAGSPWSPRPCCSGAEMGALSQSLACTQSPLLVLPRKTCWGFGGISVPFYPCPNF